MLPYLEKAFTGMIILRISRTGNYSVLFGWALNAITCILIRGKQREIKTHMDTLEGNVKMGQRDLSMLTLKAEIMWPQAKCDNFMCQFDWATGCPDIWSNIILGVSVRVFPDEICLNQWTE